MIFFQLLSASKENPERVRPQGWRVAGTSGKEVAVLLHLWLPNVLAC